MLASRGRSWVSMKRGGCKFGDGKTRGLDSTSKKRGGGCSFAEGHPTVITVDCCYQGVPPIDITLRVMMIHLPL